MVKEKINSIRTYDDDGFRRRAACLCFRSKSEDEILLVSSSKHKDQWIVPGGGIEPEEEPTIAAVREAFEEAGAVGVLGRKIGVFENVEKMHRTNLYAFVVTDLVEDWEDRINMGRRRQWFSIDAAKVELAYKPVQASYLESIDKHVNGVKDS
ncbi:Diphosphoinositol polyphosphate phosphohydrolase 2 [Mactra antiquata]